MNKKLRQAVKTAELKLNEAECAVQLIETHKPLDKEVLAWLPIPSYYNINTKINYDCN